VHVGGENLDQLFITTARVGLSEQALEDYPDSGGVFIARQGVEGLRPNKFQTFEDA
jgi:sugar lactone lactonase YvrE